MQRFVLYFKRLNLYSYFVLNISKHNLLFFRPETGNIQDRLVVQL